MQQEQQEQQQQQGTAAEAASPATAQVAAQAAEELMAVDCEATPAPAAKSVAAPEAAVAAAVAPPPAATSSPARNTATPAALGAAKAPAKTPASAPQPRLLSAQEKASLAAELEVELAALRQGGLALPLQTLPSSDGSTDPAAPAERQPFSDARLAACVAGQRVPLSQLVAALLPMFKVPDGDAPVEEPVLRRWEALLCRVAAHPLCCPVRIFLKAAAVPLRRAFQRLVPSPALQPHRRPGSSQKSRPQGCAEGRSVCEWVGKGVPLKQLRACTRASLASAAVPCRPAVGLAARLAPVLLRRARSLTLALGWSGCLQAAATWWTRCRTTIQTACGSGSSATRRWVCVPAGCAACLALLHPVNAGSLQTAQHSRS